MNDEVLVPRVVLHTLMMATRADVDYQLKRADETTADAMRDLHLSRYHERLDALHEAERLVYAPALSSEPSR